MTIDEAIRILESMLPYEIKQMNTYQPTAMKLSIEALKRCQILAKNDTYWAARPLQGETK